MGTVFQVKAIRPRKLQVDVYRLKILNALRAEGRDTQKLLQPTVFGWRGEKPRFESLIGLSRGEASVLTGPVGTPHAVEKWTWLDEGTKRHPIGPRRRPFLQFRLGYNAGSRPGVLQSRGSYYIGRIFRRTTKVIMHPGTQPRGWSELALKRRRKPYIARINKAIREANSKAYR